MEDGCRGSCFPYVVDLWHGALLGGVANAIMTAEDAGFAHFRQWVRNHYVLNGSDGREGVITFGGGHWYASAPLVGLFFSAKSNRSPYSRRRVWSAVEAFTGMPNNLQDFADQAAATYLQNDQQGCVPISRVTTAFWSQEGRLAAADAWESVLLHGADLIEDEATGCTEAALERLQESYSMSEEQVEFVWSLFSRKKEHPPSTIILSRAEVAWIRSQSNDLHASDLSLRLLKEMDIFAA